MAKQQQANDPKMVRLLEKGETRGILKLLVEKKIGPADEVTGASGKLNRLIAPKVLPFMENRSMLGLAASYGLVRKVKAMIAAGANVNIRDKSGRTALMDALEEVAKVLVRAGAREFRLGQRRSAEADPTKTHA